MGNAIATNTANQIVNTSLSINNENMTNCYLTLNSNQVVNISNNNGCTGAADNCTVITNAIINQNSALSADQNCTSSSSFTSNISSQISQAASQIAQALNQNLSLNPGSTQANNISNEIANIMANVVNEIQNTCYAQAITSQTVNITGNNGQVFKNLFVSQSAFENAISSCVFNSVAASGITSQLQQYISQSAKATVEDSLGMVLVAIAVIAVVFFLLTIEAGGAIIMIIVIIAFIAALYLLIAYLANLPPFRVTAPAIVVPGPLAQNINLVGGRTVSYSPQSSHSGSYQVTVNFPPLTTASDINISFTCPSGGCTNTSYALAAGEVAAVSPAFTFNPQTNVTITVGSTTGINNATITVISMPQSPTGIALPASSVNIGNLSANIPTFINVSGIPGSSHTLTANSSTTTGNLNIFIPENTSPVSVPPVALASSISVPFTLPSNTFNITTPNSWTLIIWSAVDTNLTNVNIS
jgi:hypothetical protein